MPWQYPSLRTPVTKTGVICAACQTAAKRQPSQPRSASQISLSETRNSAISTARKKIRSGSSLVRRNPAQAPNSATGASHRPFCRLPGIDLPQQEIGRQLERVDDGEGDGGGAGIDHLFQPLRQHIHLEGRAARMGHEAGEAGDHAPEQPARHVSRFRRAADLRLKIRSSVYQMPMSPRSASPVHRC
jgi:hypothetical protein